jgi:hypothetical protein
VLKEELVGQGQLADRDNPGMALQLDDAVDKKKSHDSSIRRSEPDNRRGELRR